MKLAALALAASLVGCSSGPSEPPAPSKPPPTATAPVTPEPATAPAPPPTEAVAAPPTTVPADFPAECTAYAELVGRLNSCAALASARDQLTRAYAELRANWVALAADQRAGIGPQCAAQADGLRKAAAASCGW